MDLGSYVVTGLKFVALVVFLVCGLMAVVEVVRLFRVVGRMGKAKELPRTGERFWEVSLAYGVASDEVLGVVGPCDADTAHEYGRGRVIARVFAGGVPTHAFVNVARHPGPATIDSKYLPHADGTIPRLPEEK